MRIENCSAAAAATMLVVLISSFIVVIQPHPLVADRGMLAALRANSSENDEISAENGMQHRRRHQQHHHHSTTVAPAVHKEEDSSAASGGRRTSQADVSRQVPCDRRPGAKRARGCVGDRRRPDRQQGLPGASRMRPQVAKRPTGGKKVSDAKKEKQNAAEARRVTDEVVLVDAPISTTERTPQHVQHHQHQQQHPHRQPGVVSPSLIPGAENATSFEDLMAARRATLLRYQQERIQAAIRQHVQLQNQIQNHLQQSAGGLVPPVESPAESVEEKRPSPVETPPLISDLLADGGLFRQQLDLGHRKRSSEDDYQSDEGDVGDDIEDDSLQSS